VKKRVARTGFGNRGGYRTIVAKKAGQGWFFYRALQRGELLEIIDDNQKD